MPIVKSKNALPTMGALYIVISFKTVETGKTHISEGNSSFVYNVRANRKQLLSRAIYNAIRREFPNRTVTAYNITLIEQYYEYYLNEYKIEKDKKTDKLYESYKDFETGKTKKYVKDKYTIKEVYIGEYKNSIQDEGYK